MHQPCCHRPCDLVAPVFITALNLSSAKALEIKTAAKERRESFERNFYRSTEFSREIST